MTYDPLALDGLDIAALDALAVEFARLARLLTSQTAARWAHEWLRRMVAEVDERMAAPGPPGPPAPDITTLNHGELVGLRNYFGSTPMACHPLPGVAAWCRALTGALVDEQDRREWVRTREHARFLMIDAEERRLAREGKPEPDLRGLPKWSEISGPRPDDEM